MGLIEEFNAEKVVTDLCEYCEDCKYIIGGLREIPSVESETAIPLSWIETHIEWLKSLDNAFSTLTAVQISSMVKKWKDEQDESN